MAHSLQLVHSQLMARSLLHGSLGGYGLLLAVGSLSWFGLLPLLGSLNSSGSLVLNGSLKDDGSLIGVGSLQGSGLLPLLQCRRQLGEYILVGWRYEVDMPHMPNDIWNRWQFALCVEPPTNLQM